jgi:polysaccharide chain length determinant protein (PEP-CTERM system associated)
MASSTGGKELSIRTLLGIARRRVLLIAAVAVSVTAAAGFFAYYRPVLFRAQALIGVESNTRETRVPDQLLTIREVMFSRPVLEPVMENFQLYGKNDIEKMRADLKITVEGDDSFHLSYEGQGRKKAMDVTNAIAAGFVGQLTQDRERQQTDATALLSVELDNLRTALDQQEGQISRYKQGAVNALPDRLDTNLRLLAATQTEAQIASSSEANDRAKLAAVSVEMGELEKQGVLNQAPSKEKTAAEVKLDEARLHLKQLHAVYTDQYPELLSAEQEVRDLEKAVAAAPPKLAATEPSAARMRYLQLKAERESLEQRLKSYTQEQGAIQSRVNQMQSRVQATPTTENAISELSRGYEATKARYNALLAKQQEMRLASGLERVNRSMSFKVVEPASLPLGPSTPQRGRVLVMGLLAGLGLGFLAAFALEQTNPTLATIREFQAFVDLPILAALPNLDLKSSAPRQDSAIPLVPLASGGTPTLLSPVFLRKNRIIALTDPESVAAEQYRLLGMKIRRQLQSKGPSPALMVTGFVGGEGKTVTALNLSLSLAGTISGRVLLIDCDLRKPRVHEYLGMPQGKGFSDLLRSPEGETAGYLWKLKDLYIMQGGTSLANPVALLSSKNASDVLQRLRAEFDFIVVDTPPVLPVADSHILAGLVDGVIMVVRARHTRREAIALGLENFQAPNLLGAVINDVDLDASGYASAYQYYNQNYAGTA